MPRWKVYEKDPDFFRDTLTGQLYWIQVSSVGNGVGRSPEPDTLVERLVALLNSEC